MEIDLQQIACRPSIGVRRIHETPLIAASAQSLAGYGRLVHNPREFPIEIVPWPAQGWRAIDRNTGNQGGVTEGCSNSNGRARRFTRATMRWATATCSAGAPGRRTRSPSRRRNRASALIWRANYHPDGGQLFHPLRAQSFVVPLDDEAEFLDCQGRVHARVSVNFVTEFGCYLGAPLRRP